MKKHLLSRKTSACEHLAELIAKAAKAMNLECGIDKSRISASHYVTVWQPDANSSVKIRVSDHNAPGVGGDADVNFTDDAAPAAAIAWLAKRFSREIPVRFRSEDFARRSDAARAAAATRAARAAAEQADQIANLKAACDAANVRIPAKSSGHFTVKLEKAGILKPESMTDARWRDVRAALCRDHGIMNTKQRAEAEAQAASEAKWAFEEKVKAKAFEWWPEEFAAAEAIKEGKQRRKARRELRDRARNVLESTNGH